jgi:SAM-dependent methyltransferase
LERIFLGEYFKKESWKIIAQTDLPYLPTSQIVIEEVFKFLSEKELLKDKKTLIDLGAGDGRVIIYATEKYGFMTTGLEINSELIQSTQEKINQLNISEKCQVIEADLYDFDISHQDIIFCFILPSSHNYFKHVIENIRPGAIILSIRWAMDVFSDFWEKSYVINIPEEVPVYIYIKKE